MDDIVRTIKVYFIQNKLFGINSLHPKLNFTLEVERNKKLSFLAMCIERNTNNLSSTWYCKPTDTGLVLNFHALAPKRCKTSVVQGFVLRIYRACSFCESFHESLNKAKEILKRNQYPPVFYEPNIYSAIDKIVTSDNDDETTSTNTSPQPKVNLFLQYKGVPTENLIKQLKRSNAPVRPILTLRKQKTHLPSLKPVIKEQLRSHVIYVQDVEPAVSVKPAGI